MKPKTQPLIKNTTTKSKTQQENQKEDNKTQKHNRKTKNTQFVNMQEKNKERTAKSRTQQQIIFTRLARKLTATGPITITSMSSCVDSAFVFFLFPVFGFIFMFLMCTKGYV